jgi:phosphoglycolate phosphatase
MKEGNAMLIFDLDGTLADAFPEALEALIGRKVDSEEWERWRGMDVKEVLRELHVPFWKVPFMVVRARRQMARTGGEIGIFEGLEDVLDALKKQGARLGVLTSNSERNARTFLRKHRIDTLFDFVSGGNGLWSKGRVLRRLAAHSRCSLRDVTYVGDEVRDIEAARMAGIKSAVVTWGLNNAEILRRHRPDFLVESPEGLLDLLG